MQIHRLFELVYVLLDHKMVTAKSLAERFEVSTRTIYRDVEVLSSAGIPIYMSQGKGGGIRLMDNFVLDRTVLSNKEQNQIISALQGIKGIGNYQEADVLDKLSRMFQKNNDPWISVELSDWSNEDTDKFDHIREAIQQKKRLEFVYFGSNGQKTNRSVQPLLLWFKDRSWYLKAYCREKKEIRTFKLCRMKQVHRLEEGFDRTKIEGMLEKCAMGIEPQICKHIVLWIDSSQAFRVYDDFKEAQIVKNDDSSFNVTMITPDEEWVYGYILSFGNYAKVLEPEDVKNGVEKRLIEALRRYQSVEYNQ